MADELHQEQEPQADLAAVERQVLAENLAAQREVLALEDFALRRLLFTEPDFALLTFTDRDTHNPKGDQHDPWNGIFIANPLSQAIKVAFEVGAAQLGLTVPAYSWLCVPQKFVNASISVSALTAATDPAVILIRLRFPPVGAMAGPYGSGVAIDASGRAASLTTPDAVPYAKGKTHNAISIPGGGSNGQDLVTAGYRRLQLLAKMTAAVVGDLSLGAYGYEDDGVTLHGVTGLPSVANASGIGGGVAERVQSFDLNGLDKVRVLVSNGNAGAQTATCVYYLQR